MTGHLIVLMLQFEKLKNLSEQIICVMSTIISALFVLFSIPDIVTGSSQPQKDIFGDTFNTCFIRSGSADIDGRYRKNDPQIEIPQKVIDHVMEIADGQWDLVRMWERRLNGSNFLFLFHQNRLEIEPRFRWVITSMEGDRALWADGVLFDTEDSKCTFPTLNFPSGPEILETTHKMLTKIHSKEQVQLKKIQEQYEMIDQMKREINEMRDRENELPRDDQEIMHDVNHVIVCCIAVLVSSLIICCLFFIYHRHRMHEQKQDFMRLHLDAIDRESNIEVVNVKIHPQQRKQQTAQAEVDEINTVKSNKVESHRRSTYLQPTYHLKEQSQLSIPTVPLSSLENLKVIPAKQPKHGSGDTR